MYVVTEFYCIYLFDKVELIYGTETICSIEWDTNTDDDIAGLREVSCGMLAAIAKHCRISILTPLHGLDSIYAISSNYRN